MSGRLIALCDDNELSSGSQSAVVEASIDANKNTTPKGGLDMADDYKVTVEELPDGKWACFLHLAGHDQPFDLGKQFKSEERAELWLNVSEATTAIDMVLAKCRAKGN
jgi:hypothetical protein